VQDTVFVDHVVFDHQADVQGEYDDDGLAGDTQGHDEECQV
jgi:hypothetical protein